MDQTKALTKLRTARQAGSLVYARDEEIELMHQQYETLITTVNFSKDDFVHVGGSKHYPLKHAQNKISEACGVSYTENCGTKERGKFSDLTVQIQLVARPERSVFVVIGDYSVIAWAQGTRIKPDGQPRISGVCEYEFSVSDRCNLDFLGKYPPKSLSEARRKLLETKKFSTRRADTGAKLAVVRELAWLPTGFSPEDIVKPMVFTQVVESNEYKHNVIGSLMKTADGRQHIANAMLGTKTKLFGPGEGNGTPALNEGQPEQPDAPPAETEPQADKPEQEIPFGNQPKEPDEVTVLKNQLLDWAIEGEFDQSATDRDNIDKLVSDNNATVEELARVVDFIRERKEAKKHK